jgi:hypothetical protein
MLWRTTALGSFSRSLEPVCWHQLMAFCKVLGPSGSSKRFGRVLRCTAGELGRLPRQWSSGDFATCRRAQNRQSDTQCFTARWPKRRQPEESTVLARATIGMPDNLQEDWISNEIAVPLCSRQYLSFIATEHRKFLCQHWVCPACPSCCRRCSRPAWPCACISCTQ